MGGECCPPQQWRRRPRAGASSRSRFRQRRCPRPRWRRPAATRGAGGRRAGPGMGNALGPAAPRAPRRGEPLGSPGSFDELHRQCKEVFPQQMEGVKLIVTKTLSSHFQVTHTVHMSTLGPSSYHFNATFVGDRQLGPTEAFPTLIGDMDNSGSLNAQVLHLVAERIRTKAVFQVGPDSPDQVRDVAVRRRVPGGRLHRYPHAGQPRSPWRVCDPGGPFPPEHHLPPCPGWGDGLPPAARGGGSHPHAGGQIHGSKVGGNAERGVWWCPCQLLPPSQRAGAGWGGAGGQHPAAGYHLRLWLPAQPATGQHGLQRAPGQ
ncbi:mitochondrial import receptor subunit TOM40B isoform X2 [Falco rusticolus]|uniref:mitochondrial import receptor subunit TOM40B isoform X2 n=1 Tax=Falco rusticolus TaxID=120794 RepID=UPI00188661A9|nr:mitochondrial import receptor subunit TOM40B isoform X2 [Falco rusticolus]XP_055553013.1 mitochondrial import receptor subunit TOM40B isoform X2 [Falco cherrug]